MMLPDSVCLDEAVDHVRLQIDLRPDLVHFAGHFPEKPILPGVAQVDWAIGFARRHFRMAEIFRALEGLKFQGLIQPGEPLELDLDWDGATHVLRFRYSSGGQPKSTGKVLFGP